MSLHKYLYLGPYFECVRKPATRTVQVHGCLPTICPKYPTTKRSVAQGAYCSACGSPTGPVCVEIRYFVDLNELTREALTELSDLGNAWLVPNVPRDGAPQWDIDAEIGALDLREVAMQTEMEWLETAFALELASLRAACATVTTRWGLIQCYR